METIIYMRDHSAQFQSVPAMFGHTYEDRDLALRIRTVNTFNRERRRSENALVGRLDDLDKKGSAESS